MNWGVRFYGVAAVVAAFAFGAGCSDGGDPTTDAASHTDAHLDAHADGSDGAAMMDHVAPDAPDDVARDGASDTAPSDAADVAHDGHGPCASDIECPMATPFCDPATHACAECLSSPNDTCPSGQYCDATSHCTAGCRGDGDCSGGATVHCNTATHTCVGCNGDGDCAPGTVCTGNACVPGCNASHGCAVGDTCCGSTCINVSTDPANCGACGTACAAGQVCCNGTCSATTTDPANCGACGTACSLPHATPACAAGACTTSACATGYADCNGDATDGCETNTAQDPAHCGTCSTACPSGANSVATCAAGRCGINCAGGFADCDRNAANGCEVALNTTVANCGACGHACTAGANATATCAMGVCGTMCNPGFGDCDGNPANGCEVNFNTTPTACGACGTVCSVNNGTPSCVAGRCGIASCNPGFGDCDGNATNGCETLTVTSSNCGTCGHVCAAGTVCSSGTCSSICAAPTSYCAGSCVNLQSDQTNCGTCGNVCASPAHAVPSCTTGACQFACQPGYGNCDSNAANGCETDVRVTAANCGSCGHACAAPAHGNAGCSSGACVIASCNAPYADCNLALADGCETNLSATLTSCGACGNVCPAPTNGTAACNSGTCGLGACNAGFGNCDGNATNGCETNLNTSNTNCGGCGVACGPGTACSAGACSSVCGAGLTFCIATGTCVNLQSDVNNCGTCSHACGSGYACTAGACVALGPANDHCAGAQPIDLSTHAVTISANTTNAVHDLDAACTSLSGADVFYSFTLTRPELVYADTVGTSYDTVLFFADSCTAAHPLSGTAGLLECDDDLGTAGCNSSLQSQVTAYLPAGTYYLVVAGYNTYTGPATVHFQHEPVGNNGSSSGTPAAPIQLPAGSSTQNGTIAGNGLITALDEGLPQCWTNGGVSGGAGNGAEQTYFWRSCPEYAGGNFTATTCNTTTIDTVIYVTNASNSSGDCDDDNSACSAHTLSSILPHPTGAAVSIPSGAGLHTFVVDTYSSSSTGAFSVAVTRP